MATRRLRLDLNNIMQPRVGAAGLTNADTTKLERAGLEALSSLWREHAAGRLPFVDAPTNHLSHDAVLALAKSLRDERSTLVVLGPSAGARAFRPLIDLSNGMRVLFAGDAGAGGLEALLGQVELPRTAFVALDSAENAACRMAELGVLKERLGEEDARGQIVAIGARDGELEKCAVRDGWRTLRQSSAGGESVLAAGGLLAAACGGVDTGAVLAGAEIVAELVFKTLPKKPYLLTPSLTLGTILFWMASARQRPGLALVFCDERLHGTCDWLAQLCAEQLDGFMPTVTGLQAAPRMLFSGRDDKVVVFIAADGDGPAAKLAVAEREGRALALAKAGRPSMTLMVPDVTPHHLGELLMSLQISVALMARLYGMATPDQPWTDLGACYAAALIGSPPDTGAAAELSAMAPVMRQAILE